jgi:acetolactate synthase-1/2/3 large subunit
MATVNPASMQPKSTTAEDTLQRKSRDAGVISGGHLVAKALKNEGVDTIFTLCGGHIIDIYDGCVDEGIRIIDVRHEQVAAHAADGYARQTGKLGCVVTTAGPGFTNAITGIATAFRSESPVLHIGGQGALTQHKMGSLQDLPHVDIITPITKFAATVPSTERVADMISMAAREAFNGAPGPCYLEIPRDILDREVDIAKAVIPRPGMYRASTRATSKNWPIFWSMPSGRRSSMDSRCGARAGITRRSRCCADSIFQATSMAPAADSCRRATRITSTVPALRRSRMRMCW